MLDALKKIIRKTPIGNVWDSMRESKYKKYVASISSDQPVYSLFCVSCNRYYKEFLPLSEFYLNTPKQHGFPYDVTKAETLNVSQYMCPGCKISDRDRLYALYLQKALDPSKKYRLVDFAPSTQLSGIIRKMPNITYRTADLFMEDVDDKVDLMNMHMYEDNMFDVFICSHILEHVDDDVQAMKELYRVLRPGGLGIAMVPILKEVTKTTEVPSIKDEPRRWRYFGQYDHVRLYAKQDYIERLKSVGFKVHELGAPYFEPDVLIKNAISTNSILYVVEK